MGVLDGLVSVGALDGLGVNGAQGWRRSGTQSEEPRQTTAAAYSCLPVQIYGFLAQCKDYQGELYGCALALRRFIDLQHSPRHRMSTALGNKCILGLWVPSIERQESVLQACRAKQKEEACTTCGEKVFYNLSFFFLMLTFLILFNNERFQFTLIPFKRSPPVEIKNENRN